jgi:hypothetical protein
VVVEKTRRRRRLTGLELTKRRRPQSISAQARVQRRSLCRKVPKIIWILLCDGESQGLFPQNTIYAS